MAASVHMIPSFNLHTYQDYCTAVAAKDPQLQAILERYGHPPFWTRTASMESLVHIILEQQVSLASAKAALVKLQQLMGEITAEGLLGLTDEALRACYFSRQKASYVRDLARAIVSKQLDLEALATLPDDDVRSALKKVKGIGDWTVDVYLLFVLHRLDVFPTGDLAMVNAFKEIKQLPKQTGKEEILAMAEHWRPYRSMATMLLWHHYLRSRAKSSS